MKKLFRFSVLLFLFTFAIFPMTEPVYVNAGALTIQTFRPLDNKEEVIGFTKIGSWNDGSFFEIITYELVGFDDEATIMKYRFRYYITRKESAGSYIYQKVPVGVFLDNKKVATFSG